MKLNKRQENQNWVISILKKIKEENKTPDENKFILEIQYKFGVSRRTAKEYIDVAKYKIENG